MTATTKRADSAEITATEGARRLGLTKQSVGAWASRSGAPMRKDGMRVMLRWPDFARWREEQLVKAATAELRERLSRASNTPDGDPLIRKLKADARKAELEVEKLERSVVGVAEAEAVIVQLLTDLRSQLMPFPRVAAPKLLGCKTLGDLEAALDAEIHRLMLLLSNVPTLDADTEPNDEANGA